MHHQLSLTFIELLLRHQIEIITKMFLDVPFIQLLSVLGISVVFVLSSLYPTFRV